MDLGIWGNGVVVVWLGFSNCVTHGWSVPKMALVGVRCAAGGELDDGESSFSFQQSQHAIEIMHSPLDQLLNLHSGRPPWRFTSSPSRRSTRGYSDFTAASSSVRLR